MSLRRAVMALALLEVAGASRALATEPFDLSCEPSPSPLPGDSQVPTNPLLFGFEIGDLTDPAGNALPTEPAPPPWDLDGRYRVLAAPLLPNQSYTLTFTLQVTQAQGSFTTGSGPDTQPPTAPQILWFANASSPNSFSACATDRAELFGLGPSVDDQAGASELRYELDTHFPDGGLVPLQTELRPLTLSDGGLVIAVDYGLEGLSGDYVLRARDQAGNRSDPSTVAKVEIGPGCTFASSTTGRGSSSLWAWGLAFLLADRRRRVHAVARSPGAAESPASSATR